MRARKTLILAPIPVSSTNKQVQRATTNSQIEDERSIANRLAAAEVRIPSRNTVGAELMTSVEEG